VQLEEFPEETLKIDILNLNGQLLDCKEYQKSRRIKLKLNMLPAGVYILRLKIGNNFQYKRIMIQSAN
jgi:hypothetical protein